ncbi:hypothetical protein GCM10009605_42350 [Nocardiopsis composta]
MQQAKATLKPFTAHCSGASPAPVSAAIDGSATAVPEMDVGTVKTPRRTAASTAARDAPPGGRAPAPGAAGAAVLFCVAKGTPSCGTRT